MHEVHVDRVMDVPAERVWALIDDFGGVYRYHPLVVASPIQNGVGSGLGAERICQFDNGSLLREEITGYIPGEEYEVTIKDPGSFPLKRGVARLGVESVDGGATRVTFRMAFEPKFGPLGWFMAKTMMKGQFRKILGQVLAGIEQHARTGEVVSRNQLTRAAA